MCYPLNNELMDLKRRQLNTTQTAEFLQILEARFVQHMSRHATQEWQRIVQAITAQPEKLWSLYQMEQTGGEPDLISNKQSDLTFYDCSPESPTGRRSICYDRKALDARKAHKPLNSALDMAHEMGITILNETQYRQLQELTPVDKKTSSWIYSPEIIRKHGGALFCDRRYDQVFTYHNGADSYYAARGFRGSISF